MSSRRVQPLIRKLECCILKDCGQTFSNWLPQSPDLAMDLKHIKFFIALAKDACGLVQAFTKAFPQQPSASTPGLVSSVQQDRRYVEALQLYRQQLEQSNHVQSQQIQAQLEFNKRLVELLAEWQANNSNAKKDEVQLLWDKDNWFSRLDRQETVQILGQQTHRLLVLVAPPSISSDCPTSFKDNLKKEIDNHTRLFLNQYYAENQYCPVEFYGDYFKHSIAAADVKRLQSVLGVVPTAVIYTDITDYQVYFHIGFWGLQGLITQFDMQPWNWEETFESWKSDGLDERFAHRKVRQTIVAFHQLLAGFATDWYYLNLNIAYEPQLVQSEALLNDLPQEVVEQYIAVLRDLQQQRQEAFQKEEAQRERVSQEPEKSSEQKRQEMKKDDGDLRGSNGINYSILRNLLAAQKWKEADGETDFLIRQLLHCRDTWIDGPTLRYLPETDLFKIDELWVKYSDGHFGFSIQNAIWQGSRFLAEFLQRINFPPSQNAYAKRTFSLNSPKGALPCKILEGVDYDALYQFFQAKASGSKWWN